MLVFEAPAVRGLGNAGGFKLMIEATGDVNYDALQTQADNLAAKGNQQPGLVGLFNGFRAPARPSSTWTSTGPKSKHDGGGRSPTCSTRFRRTWWGYYVNDFNKFGRTWQVNVQADAPYRLSAETVKQFKVRNANGDMVPMGAVADGPRFRAGPGSRSRATTCSQRRRSPVSFAAGGRSHRRVGPADDGRACRTRSCLFAQHDLRSGPS